MFNCVLCPDLGCAFCDYYKIKDNTLLNTKCSEMIQKCDFCIYQIKFQKGFNPPIVKGPKLDLNQVLQNSTVLVEYLKGGVQDEDIRGQLKSIAKQIEKLVPILQNKFVSYYVQNSSKNVFNGEPKGNLGGLKWDQIFRKEKRSHPFAYNPSTSETFACSFCDYYKINTDTMDSIKRENPKKCEHCAFKANKGLGASKLALNRQGAVRENLLTYCDIFSYVAENIPDPRVSTELETLIQELKIVLLPLKEKAVIASPKLQNDSTGICQEGEIEARAYSRGERLPFKCKLCHYSTLRQDLLQEHEESHTNRSKRLQCPTCPYAFNELCKLREHLMTHTGEVRFSCSSCSFSTAHRQSLKEHERGHSGEKPFRCSYCKSRFARSSHWLNHERRHRGEKLYKCGSCDYRSVTSDELRVHERGRHLGSKPYSCKYCPYRSATSGSIVEHERRHRGEKRHACPDCPYRSVKRSTLRIHREGRHQ